MPRDKNPSNNLPSRTIVIKLGLTSFSFLHLKQTHPVYVHPGTTSIVHETTHHPLLSTLSALVETVIELKRNGHKVVLVSSGAIGVGLKRMDLAKKPDSLAGKQVFFILTFQT